MSQENVELVRGWFERWNRRERDFLEDEVDPEVEVVSRLQPEPYRGRAGLRKWMNEIDEQFEEWQLVADDWRDAGDTVVILGRIHLRGQGSGIELEERLGWLVELRDKRLRRLRIFVKPEEALEAAGLRE
jgi:ketosteroid isomerase-like protein